MHRYKRKVLSFSCKFIAFLKAKNVATNPTLLGKAVFQLRVRVTWSRVIPEKMTVPHQLKTFPKLCGIQRFIIAFTTARHLSPS